MKRQRALCAALAISAWASPVMAQEQPGGAGAAAAVVQASVPAPIDVNAITLPSLTFTPSPEFTKDFDKYYYFHREATDFTTALGDLRDCDGLARGLLNPFDRSSSNYPTNTTAAGMVGGAITNAGLALIVGSQIARGSRRINMRRCMHFKGYQRYGLPKPIWQQFNFEEGLSSIDENARQAFLMQQAKAASGARPTTEILGR